MASAGAPPTVLGRYALGVAIGGGPTGTVYRTTLAGVAGFAKEYALKVFHPGLVERPEARARLESALRASQALMHPRIARQHEHLAVDGWLFVASDFVIGTDLAQLLTMTIGTGGALPAGAMLFVVTQIARTLGYAHGRGVLHLGLCPTNVIGLVDGDLKLTDFGVLAPRLGDGPADDRTLAARLPYLAPEQLVGGKTSPATDVFQLGALAHELFTGERAFGGGGGVEVAARIMAGSPRDAPIPPAVRDVLRKALAPRAEDRFADGAAMAGALDAVGLRAALPGGRPEVAATIKRLVEQAARNLSALEASGAVTMPLPAPPMPAPPGVSRTSVRITTDVTASGATPRPEVPVILPSTTRPAAPVPALPPLPTVPRSALPKRATLDADVLRVETLRGVGSPAEVQAGRTDQMTAEPSFEDGLSPEDLETYQGELLEVQATPSPDRGRARRIPPPPVADVDDDGPAVVDPFSDGALGRSTSRVEALPPPSRDELADALEDGEVGPARRGRRAVVLFGILATGVAALAAVYVVRPELLPLELVGLGKPAPRAAPVRAVAKAPPASVDAAKVAAVAGPLVDAAPAVVVAPPAVDATLVVAVASPDAAKVVAVAPPPPPDAAKVVAVVPPPPPDAAKIVAVVPPPKPMPGSAAAVTPSAGALVVTSTPPGASVYLDGAAKGPTPVELPASDDRHKLAVIKAGFSPYRADIDGSGKVAVALTAAPPARGPAGIKVKCRSHARLYIILDGVPTGRLCPNEDRLHVALGTHTVELYDPVTDATSSHQVDVKDTHFSVKLKVDD